jgi:hypothetical protein
MRAHFRHLCSKNISMIYQTIQSNDFWPLQSPFENLKVHWNSNSQSGSSFGSVGVHSLALSYTFGSMKCDSRVSLPHTLLHSWQHEMWLPGFIPSHFLTFLAAWNVILGFHSLTLSYTPGSMKCDSRASFLARTFVSPYLGREPNVRFAKLGMMWLHAIFSLHFFTCHGFSSCPLATIISIFHCIPT